MKKKFPLLALFLLGWILPSLAQEIQARVSVNASRVSSQVDRKIFQTLQNSLTTFLNNRKWTDQTFQTQEKISCNFLINIVEAVENNVFKATLTVQAARPVYNSSYETPLVNFIDDNFSFRYVEFQQIEFNENRVSGTDPVASNLSATLAFYVYLIIGLDFNSFSLKAGEPYFQKAQTIVNNAPEGRDVAGWRAFDGLRNRYWLMENLTNSRYNMVHDAIYTYYRKGMDYMYENEVEARQAMLEGINILNTLNNDIPNSMIVQFFFQGKSTELIRIFKKASPDVKLKVRDMLAKLDISNANAYKQELR